MFSTTEIRWFIPGEIPGELRDWFDSLGPPVDVLERTDQYLIPTRPEQPGIKLREGLIEIKRLTVAHPTSHITKNVEGSIEEYDKWSFPTSDNDVLPATEWIDVAKGRRLRTYSSAPDSSVADVGAICSLELGRIEINENIWTTICLETSGADAQTRMNTLMAIAEKTMNSPTIKLDKHHSLGYQQWLFENCSG